MTPVNTFEGLHITGATKLAGVFGWPVEHSLSPAMHNAAFRALKLDWAYLPFAVPPERLSEAVRAVRALGLGGINLTVPHKEKVIPLLNDLTEDARAIGAVNTLLVRQDALIGHNTDAAGFNRTLRSAGYDPAGKLALVLGAGGAARAVVYALVQSGADVVVLNRTPQRAEVLARSMPGHVTAGVLDSTMLSMYSCAALVVNATSVGMWPAVDSAPWPDDVPFPYNALLCDLVYNPRRTCLVRWALSAGARYIDGLWMLVYQGAESFRMWTGQEPDVGIMFSAADQQLGGQGVATFNGR